MVAESRSWRGLDGRGRPIAGAIVRFVNGRHRAYSADGVEIAGAQIASTSRLVSDRAATVAASSLDNQGTSIGVGITPRFT